jgi:ATP-dependent helicase HepA
MTTRFQAGQRWVSEGEPELGLGEVLRVAPRAVTLSFGATGETRDYAPEGAPLRRVAFKVGDTLKNLDNESMTVATVTEREGLLYYGCGGRELCERSLNPALGFGGPLERFLAGRFDPPALFDLRLAALQHQYRRCKSPVRGFLGGRIDLLPHQLGIASEVTARLLPRVLLADEVGLGKTIEACLILHRLLLTGRVGRVLILVPESLVHQWFLELLRRFNLWFHIFDEGRCRALEAAEPDANPFLDDQLLLCDLGLFTSQARRLRQALEAGWDLIVVDEAHHLQWTPTASSPEYAVVEALGGRAPGLLLLTATPEQLGMAGHFARLRLLDPDRFHDLEEFLLEAEAYRDVASMVEKIEGMHPLSPAEEARLAGILAESESTLRARLAKADARKALIEALVDQHGTSRVMFRNSRATVAGFPKRVALLHPLDLPAAQRARLEALIREWAADLEPGLERQFHPDFAQDPRIDWLAALLRQPAQDKLLLICRSQRKVEAIEAALRQRIRAKLAMFHEGMTLLQRDRNAAWFAEAGGARLLICSEIGSEGRNFQFAQHLVLFDLPLDPELLDQRLGRLDRIGQTSRIQVHVPFVLGSPQEVLVRWYQEGLNAFEENLQGGLELAERFGARLLDCAQAFHADGAGARAEVEGLLQATRTARQEVAQRLEQGRDKLLERNACRLEVPARLIEEIHRQDAARVLDGFMLAILEQCFIEVEEVAPRTYQLGSAGVLVEAFPGLTSEGLTVTFDRRRALEREDLQFLTWDHPLVTGALDQLLGSEQGTCSCARWLVPGPPGLYLEAVYQLECLAPPRFHLDRFLPPTPLRVLVDHHGQDLGAAVPSRLLIGRLESGLGGTWLERPELREELLPRLLEATHQLAKAKAVAVVARARITMASQMEPETSRLRDLRRVNRSVRSEEIEALVEQQRAMGGYLHTARVRLDALRVIQRVPGEPARSAGGDHPPPRSN